MPTPHSPRVTKPFLPIRSLWIGVVVLSLVGALIVAARLTNPDDLVLRFQPQRLAVLEAIGRPDPFITQRMPELERFERRYAEHHALTRWHILPGGLFILLAPFQLARPIRRRYPALHRWTGRMLLVAGAIAAFTGLYIGIFMPVAGLGEASIITIAGSLFLICATRAFLAIRRRDVTRHREWMLRAFGVMAAVPATRVVGAVFDVAFAASGVSSATLFAITLWFTWPLFIGVTEWWIRRTRRPAGVVAHR